MSIFNYYNQNKISSSYKNISLNKFKEDNSNKYYKAQSNNLIEVSIGGAVKNPGIYEIDKSLSINEILNEYIVLEKSADLTKINLNKKLTLNDRLIIPE